jgi:hypothetical protein
VIFDSAARDGGSYNKIGGEIFPSPARESILYRQIFYDSA